MKRLAGCERQATVQLVAHLAELDGHRLYLGAGFSSLFTYCTQVLQLSEHEAYNRIEAARAARRFPVILDMLTDASLNLTTVRLLAPHLGSDNHEELLAAASGGSKREVEELVVRHFPRPAGPSSLRKLPAAKPLAPVATLPGLTVESTPSAGGANESLATLPVLAPRPPPRRPMVAPLAPDRYAVRFTVSAKTCEKLRLAQDLLRHAVPSGDPGEILDRALTALLEDLATKKFAATERPRASRGSKAGSRHIPAEVKRAAWRRAGGRCAFVQSGRRCTERGFLEFHHLTPYGAGGEPTVDNIERRCRAHNAYEADLYYGPRDHVGGVRVESQLVPERVRSRMRDPSMSSGPWRIAVRRSLAGRIEEAGWRARARDTGRWTSWASRCWWGRGTPRTTGSPSGWRSRTTSGSTWPDPRAAT